VAACAHHRPELESLGVRLEAGLGVHLPAEALAGLVEAGSMGCDRWADP